MRRAILVSAALLLAAPGARAGDERPSAVHRVLAYVPNRVLDVLDVVRARVRVGPGVAVGVRATELADLFAGSYTTFYAGLPGPRGRRLPRLPLGIESRSGVEVSVADATVGGPEYGATEVGAGVQLLLFGADVGVDPLELVDLLAGFVLFDPLGDDL